MPEPISCGGGSQPSFRFRSRPDYAAPAPPRIANTYRREDTYPAPRATSSYHAASSTWRRDTAATLLPTPALPATPIKVPPASKFPTPPSSSPVGSKTSTTDYNLNTAPEFFSDVPSTPESLLPAPCAPKIPRSTPVRARRRPLVTHRALAALTPTLLRTIAETNSQDYIIPHVTAREYEAWESKYPELNDPSQRNNLHVKYTHGFTQDKGIRCPALIVKCMPSPYHDACTKFIVERTITGLCAIGQDPDNLALSCSSGSEFRNFRKYSSALSPTARKLPDAAITPEDSEFPSVAFEIGFSEKWAQLLEDARLFLTGTGEMTRFVVLINLTEEKPRGGSYVSPNTGRRVKHWVAERDKFCWPGTEKWEVPAEGGEDREEEEEDEDEDEDEERENSSELGDMDNNGVAEPKQGSEESVVAPEVPTPPEMPTGPISADLASTTKDALVSYYLQAHKSRSLFPPLIHPLSGTLYVLRLYNPATDGPPPAPIQPDTDNADIYPVHVLPFLSHDRILQTAARADPRDVANTTNTLTLRLSDLYNTPTQIPPAAAQRLDRTITYNLDVLGKKVTAAHARMMDWRAWERAKMVWDKFVEARQSEVEPELQDGVLPVGDGGEVEADGGQVRTGGKRKRNEVTMAISTGDKYTSVLGGDRGKQMGWGAVKKARMEEVEEEEESETESESEDSGDAEWDPRSAGGKGAGKVGVGGGTRW